MNWTQLLSTKRFGDKEVKPNSETRSRFDQDFDRLIFSHPFRKLQDKTQVFPLPEDDFVHTRLTHSLEVSSVGRSLGRAAGEFLLQKHPTLLEEGFTIHDFGSIVGAACLAHDLGNPPFGHSGESAISAFFLNHPDGQFFQQLVAEKEWEDLTNFEGNAQGFRIMNDEKEGGLALTFATLGAFTKYPKTSSAPAVRGRKSQKKYGVYRSNFEQFNLMATDMGLVELGEEAWCRHPLAFLVEAADDICYNIIDLEDGCRLGLVSFEKTKQLLAAIIGEKFNEAKLLKIEDQNNKLGMLRALAIGQLIAECIEVFKANENAMLAGEFDQALTDIIPSADALNKISILSIDKIYRSKQVLEREAGGFEVIEQLINTFAQAVYFKFFEKSLFNPRQRSIYLLMDPSIRLRLEKPDLSVYERLMIVSDFIALLTDSYAIKLYKILNGYSLPTSRG
ncbi:MAG: deoxyguanosinetriphosphate triphosphohydrolase [Cyclobacteriaceae bacterium]